MAAALQWRPPFYTRSVGEFYCFFMLPSLSPFHCFLCPSHSYCTFVKKPFFFFLEPSGLCQLLFWRCSYTTWPARVGAMETWLTPNCHKTNTDAISNSLHSSISDPSSGNYYCTTGVTGRLLLRTGRQMNEGSAVRIPAETVHMFKCPWALNSILLAVLCMAAAAHWCVNVCVCEFGRCFGALWKVPSKSHYSTVEHTSWPFSALVERCKVLTEAVAHGWPTWGHCHHTANLSGLLPENKKLFFQSDEVTTFAPKVN